MDQVRPRTRTLREDDGVKLQKTSSPPINTPVNDAASNGNNNASSSSSGSGNGSRSNSKESERSGMLNNREVKALKMGLELATPTRDRFQLKEEEEEKRAADLGKFNLFLLQIIIITTTYNNMSIIILIHTHTPLSNT